VAGERAVVAGEADGDEEERNEQSVAEGVEAALDLGLVPRSGEDVAEQVRAGDPGDAGSRMATSSAS